MPGYRGHLMVGVAVWAFAIFFFSALSSISLLTGGWLLCTLAGALFPDIDTKSQGQRLFYIAIFLSYPILFYYRYIATCLFLGFFCCVPLFVRHRGIFHSYWFLGMATLGGVMGLIILFPAYAHALVIDASFFLLGAYSHVALDRIR